MSPIKVFHVPAEPQERRFYAFAERSEHALTDAIKAALRHSDISVALQEGDIVIAHRVGDESLWIERVQSVRVQPLVTFESGMQA